MNKQNISLVLLKKRINSIMLCFSLIAIAGLMVNLVNIVTLAFNPQNRELANIILLLIFGVLGFIVIPYSLSRMFNILKKGEFPFINIKQSIILFSLILILNLFFLKSPEFWHALIIASCEEFLFRFITYKVLRENFNKFQSILIGSLIFALILHLNDNFLGNLLVEFPSSIILYILYIKFGLQSSIAFHWIHNLLVEKFL